MAFPTKLLNEGEHVVVDTRTHVKALILPALGIVVALALAVFLTTLVTNGVARIVVWVLFLAAVDTLHRHRAHRIVVAGLVALLGLGCAWSLLRTPLWKVTDRATWADSAHQATLRAAERRSPATPITPPRTAAPAPTPTAAPAARRQTNPAAAAR